MKKFTLNALLTLAFLLAANMTGLAQILPDNWIGDTDIDTYQETTEVHSGASSCRVDVNSGTQANCDFSSNVEISVTAGNSYTFTFWAYTSANVRVTGALDWVGASATYSNVYVGPATGGWSQFTFSNTVPAGATGVKVRLRFYDIGPFSPPEIQYVDDVVFESPTGTPLTVANGGFESWPSASSIASAYAISSTAVDVKYGASMTTVSAGDYLLTGTSSITFSSATIDGTDDQLVHLTGASISMTGDNILDNISDAANATDFDFYAGIMPISYTNPTNPSGIIDNTHLATYKGIVSANDAYNNTWVSDAAGERNGVMIFDANFDALAAVGDEVLFTATRAVYLNQTELVTPMLLSTLSTGNAPYGPSIINGSDFSETIPVDTDPGEKWEGQLITIENFIVDSYTDYDYRCSWSDGSNTYYFHVGDNVVYQFGGLSMTVGNTYESITGVGDWYNSGPFYRINPRSQSDIEEVISNTYIAGSFNGWSTNDPAYLMTWNANGILVLTKNLQAGDNEYKVVDNGEWYPGNNNQHVILTQAEDVTWRYSTDPNLVTHTLPVLAGDFFSTMGGNNWDPTELMGEMEDPDGDDIYTLELFIPTAGNYECKVTLNNNWDQSTGDNTAFYADGYNTTIFTYDFFNNILTVSVPPPPYITVVNPNGGEFLVKGQPYEISWDYGYWDGDIKIELLQDGFDPQLIKTNIDVAQYSIIWNVWVDQAVDTNYRIRISSLNPDEPTDDSDANFSIIDPYTIPNIVITEIMYNPPEAGNDSLEFVELYNNSMDTVNLEGCYFSKGFEFVFPSVEILPDTFLLVAINSAAMTSTFGVQSLQWTSGALSNGGEDLELRDQFDNVIDFVPYDDALPWDTMADGRGPSLTLCDPDADNAVAYSWTASQVFAAINAAGDSIYATPGFECGIAFLADFEADNTVVQVGNGVNFTDQTIGNPTSWMWTFEGGTPGTFEGQTPPYIVYNEEGMWDVTLYVSDGVNSDEVTYVDYIEVVNLAPPTNLQAIVGGEDDVQLSWDAPGVSTSELIYDNDVITDAYSYEGYTMATHMSPEGSCKVLALKYYTTIQAGDNTFNANVFGWEGTQPGTELVYTEPATAEDDMWLVLDVSAQDINFTGDFVVGFGSINATTFVGYDADLNNGRSWDFDNDQLWEQWSEAYLIRAIVEYPDGRVVEIGNTSTQISHSSSRTSNGVHSKDYSGVEVVDPINNQNRQVRDLIGYNVYRDDIQINGETVLLTEYNDAEPSIGSHDYYVTAVYDAGESDPSNVVSVVVTDLNEIVGSSVVVYPNPSDGNFTIRLAENVNIDFTLFDVTGKEVFRSSINATSTFNMPNLQKGIYFVRLLDQSSKSVTFKKLIVR